MSKYYNKEIPSEIHFVYGGRYAGKTYYEFNKLKEENKKKQEAITSLIKDSADLQLRINKAIHRIQLLQMDNSVSIRDLGLIARDLKGEE